MNEEGFVYNWENKSEKEKEYECHYTENSYVCPYCGYIHSIFEDDDRINDSYAELFCVNCEKKFKRELMEVRNYYTTNTMEYKYHAERMLKEKEK